MISKQASASMTPPAKPSSAASALTPIFRNRNTYDAPSDVAPPATKDQARAASNLFADAGSWDAQSSIMRKPSKVARLSTVACATESASASSKASGSISPKTTTIMAPAPKPMARGWIAEKVSQKRNAGTAATSCGADVSTAHADADAGDAPLVMSASATPKPSGTLCAPMATATRPPRRKPLGSPVDRANATPTPAPSPMLWIAMIARKSSVPLGVVWPLQPSSVTSSRPSMKSREHRMNAAPRNNPDTTALGPATWPS
mmetsp:Transcript_7650/g.26164  ORF Transcript_7650/g.26164 Transcript_7650/m.26164 type:complete len:260 (+) Transcript_7650:136-915(+)